jgi:peptide/nickel transport system substrate-binding protein
VPTAAAVTPGPEVPGSKTGFRFLSMSSEEEVVMKRIMVLLLALMCAASFAFAGGKTEGAGGGGGKEAVLTMANAQDLNNYNPFTQQYLAFEVLKYNCYETLLFYDAAGKLQPSLATAVDKVDDVTFRVRLRPNVKFHNGQPLLASDVKFTFNYILTQDKAAFYKPFISMVKSIDVDNDTTLTLHLSAPNPDMLGALTRISIVKEGTEDSLEAHPIGTGPFKFVEWQPNEKTELVKFAEYWDKGKPLIDRFIIRPLTDPKILVTNLESGTVQLAKDLPLEEYQTLKADPKLTLFTTPKSGTGIILEIGQKNNPALQNTKVLQALWYAMDRDKINSSCFQGLGNVIDGAYPSVTKYWKAGPKIPFDVAKAKQLLAEAGYPNGFTFKFDLLNGFPFCQTFAQIWQAGLAQAGVTLQIQNLEASIWIDHYLKRSMDIILNFGGMPSLDPSAFDNTITTPLVSAAFPDPSKILDLITKGKSQLDSAQRQKVYEDLQNIIMSQYPYYIPMEMPILWGWVKDLKGVEINPFQHILLKNAHF